MPERRIAVRTTFTTSSPAPVGPLHASPDGEQLAAGGGARPRRETAWVTGLVSLDPAGEPSARADPRREETPRLPHGNLRDLLFRPSGRRRRRTMIAPAALWLPPSPGELRIVATHPGGFGQVRASRVTRCRDRRVAAGPDEPGPRCGGFARCACRKGGCDPPYGYPVRWFWITISAPAPAPVRRPLSALTPGRAPGRRYCIAASDLDDAGARRSSSRETGPDQPVPSSPERHEALAQVRTAADRRGSQHSHRRRRPARVEASALAINRRPRRSLAGGTADARPHPAARVASCDDLTVGATSG